MINFRNKHFPQQRVSASVKDNAEWYANCIDYIIDAGIAFNDRNDTDVKTSILHGEIPQEFYKKTLNPYNSDKEKYKRFPATMRNFDIMTNIVRRYVSEYYKGIHEFNVGANNPDVVINKNSKLKSEVLALCQEAFIAEFERQYQAMVQQAQEQGQDPRQINPQDAMPDMDAFIKNFEENYIDDASKQGQDLLEYIQSMTDDLLIYLTAFKDYIVYGECYSYGDVRENEIIKEYVPVDQAFPIPNTNFFVENHDMFARRLMLSYTEILDMFSDFLSDKDKQFIEDYYAYRTHTDGKPKFLTYNQYFETYPDVCGKFSDEERRLFKEQPINVYDVNSDLYEVWHVVWRGDVKQGILTYINETGIESKMVVDETFEFNPELGHINIEWVWKPQVYEGYRIGTRSTAIYPIKYKPVSYNRDGKLPYNGIMEVLPGLGKFSIVEILTPYQILRNIMIYHREMVIAKNKMLILLLPQSLIEDDAEDRIYKMAATGTLLLDDSVDSNMAKAQQIRLLNANLGNYISELTALIEKIKLESREAVDMNEQRFGQIAQSAGKATTQEAITRSSMGSIILFAMFDEFRKTDYNRDLDYCKFAFIDGLEDRFWNKEGEHKYISLDVNALLNSELSTTVRNNEKERDKIQQLKQWAFSAAQNGDLQMAMEAITNDNVSSIKKSILEFTKLKEQHENELKQAEQMIEQQKIQNEILKIQAKGEEDRKTEQLKAYYDLQEKYIDIDVSQLRNPFDAQSAQNDYELKQTVEQNKLNIENQKMNIEREKITADTYNKAADRQVKLKELETQLKIAKTNKNRYDR